MKTSFLGTKRCFLKQNILSKCVLIRPKQFIIVARCQHFLHWELCHYINFEFYNLSALCYLLKIDIYICQLIDFLLCYIKNFLPKTRVSSIRNFLNSSSSTVQDIFFGLYDFSLGFLRSVCPTFMS